MRYERKCLSLILAFALPFGAAAVYGRQQGDQLAAEIGRVRQEIQELERAPVPAGRADRHRSVVEDKRIRLHGLLQQQRDELIGYRDLLVRNRAAQSEVQDVERDIRMREAELEEVKGALRASMSGQPPAPAQPQPRRAAATDPAAATPLTATQLTATPTATTPAATSPTAVAPVIPAPAAAAPPAATAAQATAAPDGDINAATAVSALSADGAEGAGALGSCSLFNTPQENQLSKYEVAVCKIVKVIQQDKVGDPLNPFPDSNAAKATFTLNQEPASIQAILAAKLIRSEERAKFLIEAEEARTDKQVGSTPLSSGSTSLVVKGSAPTVLGFATENGALTESRSGTTVTFRGNPIGIFKFLNGRSFDDSYLEDENDPATRLLKRFSFATSFDTDRGGEPGVFTADRQQLSAFSLRYEFVNERDPRHRKNRASWQRFIAGQGVNLTDAVASAYHSLTIPASASSPRARFRDPVLQAWLEETQALISAAAPADVEPVFKGQLDKFPASDQVTDETRDALRGFTDAFAAYVAAREEFLEEVAKRPVISLEYTNKREINAPDLSNFNFIAETGIFGGKADLTGNASLSFYNSRPQGGPGRVRDFRFAAQLDAPVKLRDLGSFVFSFAGKYERVLDDAVALDGTVLPGTRGDIGVGQFKLTLPFLEGTGVRFPLSVTFANRTELVREKEVRGNFGFTLDLDKIFASLRPF